MEPTAIEALASDKAMDVNVGVDGGGVAEPGQL